MNNKIVNILILILLALFISFRIVTACNQLEREPDTQSSQPEIYLPATYTGMIPCVDCPGIEVYLLLKENNRFTELNWFRGQNPEPNETEGTWHLQGDTLSLYDRDQNRL
ncbi:MAG: copper resistance protein NlpE N-terminal domain-containing protein, partial [Balneolaceae bacterium]|nr:copper resistance protein NlpE N-terminal domain-containing protein [Balneolaceae bacterium]